MDKHFTKFHKLVKSICVIRKDEGYICQIGQKNRSVINSNIFLFTYHIFDNLSDRLKRKESIVELYYLVVTFYVCRNLFYHVANVSRKVAYNFYL